MAKDEKKDDEGSVFAGCVTIIIVVAAVGWFFFHDKLSDLLNEEDDDDHVVASAVVTPSSFCGVEFGENIETRFRDAKLVDRSDDRKLNHGMSYMEATVTLGTPFRNFRKGWVYAAMTSKKVYQVGFSYEFPRGVSKSVDEAECEGVIRALKTKYGVNPSVDEGCGGDKDYQFRPWRCRDYPAPGQGRCL